MSEPGLVRVRLVDPEGHVLATSNPMRVDDDGPRAWWGDLHGQSAETIGINTADDWFRFARDKAFLDVCAHQANDFQITSPFWARLQEVSARWDEPGRFVTLPGYEWSGNTAVGGDRNVYFRHEGRPIRRSSHALLTDRSDTDTDATTATALFEALASEDAVAYAHVGGRWADLSVAHDGRIERAVEIHSDWGTFEWLLHDALRLGHRVGVVANSDGHKGRPGASWPGASTFGAYGGITCFFTERLDRDGIFEAIRARRTVATTGCRIDLGVRVPLVDGRRFREDPALGPTTGDACDEASIGDIVSAVGDRFPVRIHATPRRRSHESTCSSAPRSRRAGSNPEPDGASPCAGKGRSTADADAKCRGMATHTSRGRPCAPSRASTRSIRRTRSHGTRPVCVGARSRPGTSVVSISCATKRPVRTSPCGRSTRRSRRISRTSTAFASMPAAWEWRCRRAGSPMIAPLTLDWTAEVSRAPQGDTAIGVRVLLEDGHVAWSSPIYVVPRDA